MLMSYQKEIRIDDKSKSGYIGIITGILVMGFAIYLFYMQITINNPEIWWLYLLYAFILILGFILLWLGQIFLKNRYSIIDNDSIRFYVPSFWGSTNKIEYKWANLERMEVHLNPLAEMVVYELWLMYEEETKKFPLFHFNKNCSFEIFRALKKCAEKKHIKFISDLHFL